MSQASQGEHHFFAEFADGRVYCTYHAPDGTPRLAALFIGVKGAA